MENIETVETLAEPIVSEYEQERGKPTPSLILPNQKLKVFSSGELYDEVTGIRLSVSEIFQEES